MPRRLGVLLSWLALLSLACARTLTVTPDSATVVAGTSPILFTATPPGASDEVTWTLTGPGSIDPTTGTTTTYTPPAVLSAATTATLTATSGDLTATVTLTLNRPDPMTISGFVISTPGARVAGANVAIGTQTTTSDANGAFSIPNVIPPYDLVVYDATGDGKAVIYQGLTRANPNVIWLAGSGSLQTSTVEGSISGGDALPEVLDRTTVAFGSPEGEDSSNVTNSPYSLNPEWTGTSATTTGTLHVLQVRPSSGIATQYRGYGTRSNVAVVNAGITTSQDLTMSALPGTATISGAISVPAGYTLANRGLGLELPGPALISLGSEASSSLGFNFVVPTGINSTNALSATALLVGEGQTVGRLSGIAPGTAGVTLQLLRPAVQIAPTDGASGVTSATELSWNPVTGGVHIVSLNGSSGNPDFVVFTSGTTTHPPDLFALGIVIPSGSAYSWTVTTLAPFANLDDFAGRRRLLESVGTLSFTATEAKDFTIQ